MSKASITDKYDPSKSGVEVRECEDKPKQVGKLNVAGFKLESTVEVRQDEDRPKSVGKLNVGKTWQPTSTVEVQRGQQNDVAQIAPKGKLDPNAFIKSASDEPKPEKRGPLSMEDLVKADQRDN